MQISYTYTQEQGRQMLPWWQQGDIDVEREIEDEFACNGGDGCACESFLSIYRSMWGTCLAIFACERERERAWCVCKLISTKKSINFVLIQEGTNEKVGCSLVIPYPRFMDVCELASCKCAQSPPCVTGMPLQIASWVATALVSLPKGLCDDLEPISNDLLSPHIDFLPIRNQDLYTLLVAAMVQLVPNVR